MAQVNQELQALYSELINRMKQGVEMHEQLADYYAFLNHKRTTNNNTM